MTVNQRHKRFIACGVLVSLFVITTLSLLSCNDDNDKTTDTADLTAEPIDINGEEILETNCKYSFEDEFKELLNSKAMYYSAITDDFSYSLYEDTSITNNCLCFICPSTEEFYYINNDKAYELDMNSYDVCSMSKVNKATNGLSLIKILESIDIDNLYVSTVLIGEYSYYKIESNDVIYYTTDYEPEVIVYNGLTINVTDFVEGKIEDYYNLTKVY